jgi:hypothetical protein
MFGFNRSTRTAPTTSTAPVISAMTARAVLEQVLAGAKRCAAESSRPTVFLLSDHGHYDWALDSGYSPSWGENYRTLANSWETRGVRLSANLVTVGSLLPRDFKGHAGLLELLAQPEQLQQDFTDAGLTGMWVGAAAAFLADELGDRPAEQYAAASSAMVDDVAARTQTLMSGTSTVAEVTDATSTSLEVTTFGTDRVVFASGRLSCYTEGRFNLDHLSPREAITSAEVVFLAGQPVTATADKDGSVRLRIAGRRICIPPSQAPAVLTAVGQATLVTQQ